MSMIKTIAWIRAELAGAAAGRRTDAVTLDDLLSVVLRLDPYTMAAAEREGIAPEKVSPRLRAWSKQACHRSAWEAHKRS